MTQDVVAPWFKNGLSSKTRLLLTRIFIVLIGIFILIWGLWYELGQDLWDYMLITGSIYMTGAMALLFFGIYWKRTSKVGAYAALICGFLAVTGLSAVQNLLGFVLNPVKLHFGFIKEIPIEDINEKTVLVANIPIEEITTKTVEVYDTIGSEIIGLTVLLTAVVLIIVGSLVFPDKKMVHEEKG